MAPPQQQQPQGDNSLAALWITLGLFALLAVIWFVFHAQIVWFFLQIKYAEAALIGLFTPKLIPAVTAMKAANPAAVNYEQLSQFANVVGRLICYPVGVILLTLAVTLFMGHPALRFKKTHTMKTLLEQEKYNWPQIMPVSMLDLVKQDIEKGPWAMALTPLQFAKKHGLIHEERDPQAASLKQRKVVNISLLRTEAYQVFALQVGNYWRGLENLNSHSRALFAIFAARAEHDVDAARTLSDQISLSVASGHLDFSGTDELINKYKDVPVVKMVTEKHAFILTVMASMLMLARTDGVLASADFLWLKVVDRPLWFMLNAIGRQTPPTEVAGAYAHWLAEVKLGRRISVPMVDEAVKALDVALREVIYVPDE